MLYAFLKSLLIQRSSCELEYSRRSLGALLVLYEEPGGLLCREISEFEY